jgi:hypothetical protein
MAWTTVTVGTDGIEIRRAARRRFIRLDEIRDIQITPKALRVIMVSGETIALLPGAPIEPVGQFGATDVGLSRGLLGERILEAVRNYRKAHSGTAAVDLCRGHRSAAEWLASLRAVGLGAGDYRSRVVPVEELQRLLADATAATDVRVGAAVALRIVQGGAGAEGIRIAAESTAAPSLRDALREIADETDEKRLAEHLDHIT